MDLSWVQCGNSTCLNLTREKSGWPAYLLCENEWNLDETLHNVIVLSLRKIRFHEILNRFRAEPAIKKEILIIIEFWYTVFCSKIICSLKKCRVELIFWFCRKKNMRSSFLLIPKIMLPESKRYLPDFEQHFDFSFGLSGSSWRAQSLWAWHLLSEIL